MHELALTLLQIIVIVVSGRAVAALLRLFGQPSVIGEVTAGILLGPSALGVFAPELFTRLFPPQSIPTLTSLSQIGLVLFMFLVGLEFAPEWMRERRHDIVVISHTSIVVPFILGTALALYLYPRVSTPGVAFRGFALFLGISMSITAFPVLARILTERNLLRTKIGNTVIACAAVDDVTAWSILAFVVMIVRSTSPAHFAVRILLLLLYVLLMLYTIRPLLHRLMPRLRSEAAHEGVLTFVLLVVLASASVTEALGIHALFGAFLVGAILPREGRLVEMLVGHTRGLTTILFLPLFFAITGLRTNFGLLQGSVMWTCFALVLFVAIVGKFGGAMISAVAVGFSWRDATAIGALMNTRGLMEMVVLNIGLDIGVVSRPLFTMCVLMALVTTAMTTPFVDRLLHSAPVGVPDKLEVLT
ncbi:MAG TPA: cation:proton antiporter [Thermoanaerobaculia bacterium]|nr:cation:proton antiporter [Thermoanaerobaculia bacterium]